MKSKCKKLFDATSILICLLSFRSLSPAKIQIQDKKLVIDVSHLPDHITYDSFYSEYSEARNTVVLMGRFTDFDEVMQLPLLSEENEG